jgi:hypothetical protein
MPKTQPVGLDAALGRVTVRITRSDARFDVAGRHLSGPQPIEPPGGIIGQQGGDASLLLVGPDAAGVSRRHLLVVPVAMTWTVLDLGSTNHTYELAHDPDTNEQQWVALAPHHAVPVHAGMTLSLGQKLRLTLDLYVPPLTGSTTPGDGPPRRIHDVRVVPRTAEALAHALLARRRDDPRDHTVPTVRELAATLSVSTATVYRRGEQLRELPPVAARGPADSWQRLAEALAIAYPYLLFRTPSSLA